MLRFFALSLFASIALAATPDFKGDEAAIRAIFAAHDRLEPGLDDYMRSVADDIVLLPNRGPAVEGKAAYRKHVMEFHASGKIQIRHEIVHVDSFAEVAIVRGRAVGSYTPPGGGATSTFETHNLFVLRRSSTGELRVWKIIFNDAPKSG